ncbi:hypothetical protein HY634_02435 [Candidatus Uhrbacteria bacterium]|nr:hypothetical protein [Candidatus Uhrbacteria bacterium]
MRRTFAVSVFTALILSSGLAHAVLDCWYSFSAKGTVCMVLSVMRTPTTSEPTITCADAAWLLQDYCPVIEDTGDGTEAEFLLCEDAPLLVSEFCDAS